ncbi:sugar kinase [candidate division KSB3 bacterium]|uniref:Sugar kinase n=1 Tax=candidate division KSB3 bacterium TaxID=2044937 RepID=A0A9D5JZV8_9BACT|nr:sugar kinase [candidate division KSB3 bacterium]MBD3327414.1 sugar kinase [candidate division KSB3 bacterium]
MDAKVGCVGDLLVEIMRPNVDDPLNEPGTFMGPYASGASGIFIDAIARLGIPASFVGAVGKDDFGDLILKRFEADGVDTSHIKVMEDYTTGVAFVTYFHDGSRKFIYHLPRAATGQIYPEDIDPAYIAGLDYLHIVGSTMSINEQSAQACLNAIELVTQSGGKVSFDPNFRPELISATEVRERFHPLLTRASIVFPTHEEVAVLTGEDDLRAACQRLLEMGPEIVAVKQAKEGSTVFTADAEFHAPAFTVKEIDPTGAGDCYCAGFLAGILKGMDLQAATRFANAVGALAVTKKGPMEGAPTLQQVQELLG